MRDENYREPYDRLEDLKQDVRNEIAEIIHAEYRGKVDPNEIEELIDDDGSLTEVVDLYTPIHYATLMELAMASDIYMHENELPPAFDGKQTPANVVATAIYEILMDEAWATVREQVEQLIEEGQQAAYEEAYNL